MECKDFKKLLSQFLDNQLDEKQQQINKHLKGCPKCMRALESVTEMVNLIHNIKEVNPPDDFLQKVNKKLDQAPIWQKVLQRLGNLFPVGLPVKVLTIMAVLFLAIRITMHIGTTDLDKEQRGRFSESRNVPSLSTEKDEFVFPEDCDDGMCYKIDMPGVRYEELTEEETQMIEDKEREFQVLLGEVPQEKEEIKRTRVLAKVKAKVVEVDELEEFDTESKDLLEIKGDVLELKPGNFISKYRQQNWVLNVENLGKTKKNLRKLVKEFEATDLVLEQKKSAGKKESVFNFELSYGRLNTFLLRLEQLGKLEKITPLPIVRVEVYTSARGGINPLLFEETISVNITLRKQ